MTDPTADAGIDIGQTWFDPIIAETFVILRTYRDHPTNPTFLIEYNSGLKATYRLQRFKNCTRVFASDVFSSDQASPKHPHEPAIPPLYAADGSCHICRLLLSIAEKDAELEHLRNIVIDQLVEKTQNALKIIEGAGHDGSPDTTL
ncbi:MAG TPA: hypothetical protein VN843_34425 [Anaerolineales bacterium]|nr:hypothetical protein [Anaerolineales bacterium]